MPQEHDNQTETSVLEKVKTRKPSLYKVILHNDDFTTMDFVVFVLRSVFSKTHKDALELMITIHQAGSAVCGIYPQSIAETKAAEVTKLARQHDFPLLCTIEKE